MTKVKPELEIQLFENARDWRAWLETHHADSPGVWLRIAKKAAPLESVSYALALDEALCFGWIDGQSKTFDDQSWLQKFTPRARRSLWSKVNREKVARLIESAQMQPAGWREIERAQQDGRWDAAYDPQSQAPIPEDLQRRLDATPSANACFQTLNKQNRYAILFGLQTAKKPETRARRLEKFLAMLERGEKTNP